MSLLFYFVAQTSFLAGSHYIQGGSYKLSDFLADMITSNRGEILTRHLVTKIITENGKATGVEYRQNTKKESEAKKASAWTQPGGGFGTALGSGYQVASKILNKDKS